MHVNDFLKQGIDDHIWLLTFSMKKSYCLINQAKVVHVEHGNVEANMKLKFQLSVCFN